MKYDDLDDKTVNYRYIGKEMNICMKCGQKSEKHICNYCLNKIIQGDKK